MGDLRKHFSRAEFACKCGCGFDTVDTELLDYLEDIRSYFNSAPITITSGCRCAAHNEAVGGSANSQHKLGRAADIIVAGAEPDEVADYAERIGVMGIGRYNSFSHVDSRTDGPRGWSGA